MKLKFAIVISHPNQHFGPTFQRLARIPGLEVKVYYVFNTLDTAYRDADFGRNIKWDVPLLEGHNHQFLNSTLPVGEMNFWNTDSPLLNQELNTFQPDAVWIFGYNLRINWRALKWAKDHQIPILFLGDSELIHPRSAFKRVIKNLFLPYFFKQCTRIITIGDHNESYYRHYGVANEKFIRGCYPIDTMRFKKCMGNYSTIRSKIRESLNLSGNMLLLAFSGKLIPRKRPMDAIHACAILKKKGIPFKLILIGEGILRKRLEKEIKVLKLEKEICLLGFINQREIPQYLIATDILLMPSESDPHPLAVTEAMACGATVIGSDAIGCIGSTDILCPGETGLVYPCGNIALIAEKVEKLAREPALLRRLRRNAFVLAHTQSANDLSEALLRALKSIEESKHNERINVRWPADSLTLALKNVCQYRLVNEASPECLISNEVG